MNWWIVGLLILVTFFIFKFKEVRHKLSWFLIIALIIFFAASFGNLYTTNNLDLGTFDGVVKAGKIYFSWLVSLLGNLGKISGYAVEQNWGLNTSLSGG